MKYLKILFFLLFAVTTYMASNGRVLTDLLGIFSKQDRWKKDYYTANGKRVPTTMDVAKMFDDTNRAIATAGTSVGAKKKVHVVKKAGVATLASPKPAGVATLSSPKPAGVPTLASTKKKS